MSKLQTKLAELVETTTGAEGAALIDIGTGMTLAQAGTPDFDLDVAAQGFATAVRYQLRTISDLGLTELAEGMLVSQGSHHHIFAVRTTDNREGTAGLPGCTTGRRDALDGPPSGRHDGVPPARLTQAVRLVRERRHHQVASMTPRIPIVTYRE